MDFAAKDAALTHFFAALTAGDIETVRAGYHPDAAIWHNNDNATQGVEDNLRTLGWVSKNIKGLSYDEIRRTEMDDGRVIQEHVLHGAGPNGKPLGFVACILFTFDDQGRITRLEEYLDSAQVAVLSS
jgi:uncharacterized protein